MTDDHQRSLTWRQRLTSTRQGARRRLHQAIAKVGIDAVPMAGIRHAIGRRARLLHALDIDLVVDVGANVGQFGCEIRAAGYAGLILSIEPLSDAYDSLRARADRDGAWMTMQCALGESGSTSTIHIAGNSASSSLLEMLPDHERAAPETHYIGRETVSVRRLDSILDEHEALGERLYLKIDVQGYELAVLRGAGAHLGTVAAIQLELSLAELYADAPTAPEVDSIVTEAGYRLAGIEPGFTDPGTGRLLQMDGIYVRSDLLAGLAVGAST